MGKVSCSGVVKDHWLINKHDESNYIITHPYTLVMKEEAKKFRLILKDNEGRGVFVDFKEGNKFPNEKLKELYINLIAVEQINEMIEKDKVNLREEEIKKKPDIEKLENMNAKIKELESKRDKLKDYGKEDSKKE